MTGRGALALGSAGRDDSADLPSGRVGVLVILGRHVADGWSLCRGPRLKADVAGVATSAYRREDSRARLQRSLVQARACQTGGTGSPVLQGSAPHEGRTDWAAIPATITEVVLGDR
jgi:hypothetical protein